MPLVPAASSGLALVQAGRDRLDASAARTAAGVEADLPAEAVEQVIARHEVALGARVLQTSDDLLGALLDVRA